MSKVCLDAGARTSRRVMSVNTSAKTTATSLDLAAHSFGTAWIMWLATCNMKFLYIVLFQQTGVMYSVQAKFYRISSIWYIPTILQFPIPITYIKRVFTYCWYQIFNRWYIDFAWTTTTQLCFVIFVFVFVFCLMFNFVCVFTTLVQSVCPRFLATWWYLKSLHLQCVIISLYNLCIHYYAIKHWNSKKWHPSTCV